MRRLRYCMAVAGLLVITGGVIHFGAADVFAAFTVAGWGVAGLVLLEASLSLIRAAAWRELSWDAFRLSLLDWVAARWIRQSVSQLLPVAQIGGDVVGAQTLNRRGSPGDFAAAVTVVDLSMSAVAQMLVTVSGLVVFALVTGGHEMIVAMTLTTLGLSVLIGVFLWLQQRGLFSRLAARMDKHSTGLLSLVGEASRLDEMVKQVYARRARVARNLGMHVMVQFAGTLEVMLVCYLVDAPIAVLHAFLLQTLTRAARAAAFFVPGGLGVQEVTIVWLATAFGLNPVTGVALALLKRARELLLGLPALALWPLLAGSKLPVRAATK